MSKVDKNRNAAPGLVDKNNYEDHVDKNICLSCDTKKDIQDTVDKIKHSAAGYPGSKYANDMYKKIINQFPPHKTFISGFLGNCAVFREKKPAQLNIAIEKNGEVLTKYWNPLFYSYIINHFIVGDFISLVHDFNNAYLQSNINDKETLIYLDPPYLMSTRRSGRKYYKFELTDIEHTKLLTWCIEQNCLIAISHYECDLYNDILIKNGWRKIRFQVMTRKGPVMESLYMNYPEPKELHQYDFLGKDKTDRQRIKRKINSLIQKLNALPELERNAIIKALI